MPTRALGRTAAVATIGSVLVHLLSVDVTALGSLAMLGMALACLPCAWHLWRSPTGGVWALTAAVDAAMLVVHAQLHVGAPDHSAHLHGAGTAPGGGLMWAGLGLVAAQLLLAGLAALRLGTAGGPRHGVRTSTLPVHATRRPFTITEDEVLNGGNNLPAEFRP